MTGYFSRFWDRLSLTIRLLFVIVLSMAVSLLAAAYQTARDTAADVQRDLTARFEQEMEMIRAMAAPALISGAVDFHPDPARLKAAIEDVKHGPEVVHVAFRDTTEAVSVSHDTPMPLQAPLWFSRWCGLEEIRANRGLVIDGQYHGVLTLVISPNYAINQAWGRYLKQMQLLFLCFVLVWIIMCEVLRRGLLPLKALAAASETLGQGDLSIRLDVHGSPELRTSLANFNEMAFRIEAARSELSNSEKRYRVLIEQAPDAIVVYDADLNRFLEANTSAEKLFGRSHDELLRTDPQSLYSAQQVAQKEKGGGILEDVQTTLSGEAVAFERKILRADGEQRICSVRVVNLPDENRRLVRASLIDITERKRLEQEQKKLQVKLAQSQRLESVGALAGGVAHDYNNMLGVIIGYTELALSTVDPQQQLHEDLQEIHKAAIRSAEVTRQLLTFARQQNIVPMVIDLNETVTGMFNMLRRLIGEDIDISWLPEPDLWPVKMDPSQIDQMIANLCINARDAIAGVGKIIIETGKVSFDEVYSAENTGVIAGDFVLLAISDNGCGMDKEMLARIFEPFFTTKGVGQGTGLGLATVYGIVQQNNGFINVYSEPGQGTTFKVYLPRCQGTTGQPQRKGTPGAAGRGQETVLLVEDEEAIIIMTKVMLERQGYTVLQAATPSKAISLAESFPKEIHLLITDVVMPEMNGRELSERIQAFRPGIRCLFMSGYTADVIANRGVLNEGVQFIQKPFSIENLVSKVHDALAEDTLTGA